MTSGSICQMRLEWNRELSPGGSWRKRRPFGIPSAKVAGICAGHLLFQGWDEGIVRGSSAIVRRGVHIRRLGQLLVLGRSHLVFLVVLSWGTGLLFSSWTSSVWWTASSAYFLGRRRVLSIRSQIPGRIRRVDGCLEGFIVRYLWRTRSIILLPFNNFFKSQVIDSLYTCPLYWNVSTTFSSTVRSPTMAIRYFPGESKDLSAIVVNVTTTSFDV